ncbi:putative ATP-grasp-modified RiPP [Actinomadura harenae]|uniref:Putative ATP-grasp-modified RiPP n=1 Tax=Actinomadura harenae TaxID=2483351 RepID=A0A3M2MD66_9ACTN|nr:putative ATP-grasp-modified RiPP [Actinomadura harenae]RMI46843.1 putative ATP-grasp-modified RiPP [Actinomadura harenae]
MFKNPEPINTLLCSPDGESRGLIARVGDMFPLDPMPSVQAESTAPPSTTGVRPWGLRFIRQPRTRPLAPDGSVIYDPVRQLTVEIATGNPVFRHKGGTKETTGTPDGSKPSPEETTKD